jgi:hypothetical protein
MEVRGSLAGLDHRDVVGQLRIERLAGTLGRRAALHVDRGDVGDRVNPGVRPAGDREPGPGGKEGLQRLAQDALDRPQPGLRSPATEAGSVVLER